MNDHSVPPPSLLPSPALMMQAVLRLARFDASGARVFDSSVASARRSFQLLLPYALIQVLYAFISGPALEQLRNQFDVGQALIQNANMTTVFASTLLSGLAIWFGFLVLAHFVMKITGQVGHFPRLVSLHNWTMILQESIKLIPYALLASGLGSTDLFKALLVLISFYSLCFQWFVYRQTSDMAGWAFGLVLLRGLTEGLGYFIVAQLVVSFA